MKLSPAFHVGNALDDLIPVFPFCLDEGANPEAYIEALGMDFFDEFHQIISTFKVILVQQKNEFEHLLAATNALSLKVLACVVQKIGHPPDLG
jgi:hypothetical protein